MNINLWLFDIDGLLININNIHLEADKRAYKKILHQDVSGDLILSSYGMSESEMYRFIFKKLKLPHDQNKVNKLAEIHLTTFKEIVGSTNIKPLAGVKEFLTHLQSNDQYLGIITGNFQEKAELILKNAGLIKFFPIISFARDNNERWQIVQAAIDKAKEKGYAFEKVIVLGDTPYYVEAGKHVGALTVAVATGTRDFDELKSTNPDVTLKTLEDYNIIFEKLK